MTKKIITMIMAVLLIAVMFTGCGNMSMGLGNFSFEKIHVDTYNYNGCFTIEEWYEYGTGIEVKTREAGYMYIAEGMYIMIEDDCPFCEE